MERVMKTREGAVAGASRATTAMIGAVPLPYQANGTAHNRLIEEMVPSPGTMKAGPEAVGAATGPSTTTPGLAPDVVIVRWNIASLARCFHRQGQSQPMDWPHVGTLP
jgi:hypothetical protein